MSNDDLQEGYSDYVKKAFEGEIIKEEKMEFQGQKSNFGDQPPVLYFKDVEEGTKFKITCEPKSRIMKRAGGEVIKDKNSGEPAVVWDIPVEIYGGEARTLNIYNYKMNHLARSVGAQDSKELIGLEYTLKLEKNDKGKYIMNILLVKEEEKE